VSFRLLIVCDHRGCDVTGVVEQGSGLNVEPMSVVTVEETKGGLGGSLVFDTGWIDAPEGWTVTARGEFCPAHSTRKAG
jgi:hypothetical protein